MFFAAREAVHGYFLERGRKAGLEEGLKAGRKAERERIEKALAARGVPLTPELVEILAGEPEQSER